jgi:hypothetical protein
MTPQGRFSRVCPTNRRLLRNHPKRRRQTGFTGRKNRENWVFDDFDTEPGGSLSSCGHQTPLKADV